MVGREFERSGGVVRWASSEVPRLRRLVAPGLLGLFGFFLGAASASSETGADAWLRYERITDPAARAQYATLPGTVIALGDSMVFRSARDELVRGVGSMLDRRLVILAPPAVFGGGGAGAAGASKGAIDVDAIVLGTIEQVRRALPRATVPDLDRPDGFWLGDLRPAPAGAPPYQQLIVAGGSDRGVLYGTFALLRRIALGEPIAHLDDRQEPAAPLRWVNEWNNLDGTIERGYAGPSIFFEHDRVRDDLSRVAAYARLLASVGVNACAVNNVNANPLVITRGFIPDLVRLAAQFRPWGVQLAVAVDFSSPTRIGGLETFDPVDPRVAAFWKRTVDDIYAAIPDFAGFVLKADSEGRLGPSAYGRTHADAANVIARALAPHRGVLFYRGFVYDHHMDWRNPTNDRARAADDNFRPLDGRFDDNVVLQIKHGPIDFQVREPASPLFGTLRATNQAIEVQITQEYTGQQRHVCFLVPMWRETLDFDLQVKGAGTPVKALVSGATFARPLGGFVGVSNVGRDANWLGHDLAMANLYGFGRLAWNPDLSSERIAGEWTRMTFGPHPGVVSTIVGILLESWPAYERYTGPLGAGTLTDIINVHYGPGIESSERNGWGQWHRADERGIGMDRTVRTGTGYIGQYSPPVAAMYESIERCPDELLLFMHHVPYTHRLKSGKTVIQHIYDAHEEGAAEAASFVTRWRQLEGLIDRERYAAVLAGLEYQAGHAVVWLDAVNTWFLRTSGIADENGRAGHFPGRVEAESMTLDGYTVEPVTPWETASSGRAIVCATSRTCTATHTFAGDPGDYDLIVQYFDESDGASTFRLLISHPSGADRARSLATRPASAREIERWRADADLPSPEPNGHTSTRRVVHHVPLTRGDVIRIEGTPDGGERAVIDYVEIKKP
jgi:alpha-glucuronidase